MDEMITVYLYGKKYTGPSSLTIMEAFEYSGYQLVRGCGCRNGFCGACATIYRIKGETTLHGCLACSTKVEDNMCVASLPFFPLEKEIYNIEEIRPTQEIMMQLYPEIYSCIGCNACTKACTQQLNTMQYIAYAQRGEYEKCAEESFDCVMCGVCSSRCPAGISHPQVALLARRLTGKYLKPEAKHLTKRVEEIAEEMEIPVERVREILKISQEPVSLETPIGEEEDSHLGDFIQDENVPVPADAAAFTLLKEQLVEVLSTLTEREQKVLRLRFGLDDGRARTLEEVGKEFNVTRERIRQIEAKALRKLRHPSRSRKLRDYLE